MLIQEFARFFRNRFAGRDLPQKKTHLTSIREEFAASLGVMRLEARRVLNAAALPTGPLPPPPPAAAGNVAAAAQTQQNTVVLTVDAAQAAQKQSADIFVVKRVGANVDVTMNGSPAVSKPLSSIGQLHVNGSDHNNKLIIDYSQGNPLPAGGITFSAGKETGPGGNQLILEGGTAGTVTYNLASANSGSITIDSTTISYSGIDSIKDDLSSANRAFVLAAGSSSMTLGDGRAAGTAEIKMASGATLDFADPSRSLAIDISSPNSGMADTLTLAGFHDLAGANLMVKGGTGDQINVIGPVTLNGGALAGGGLTGGNLTAQAGTIDVTGSITSAGGRIELDGTQNVTLASTALLQSAGGSVFADAGSTGTLLDFGSINVSQTAPGGLGGTAMLLGEHVGLSGAARVDASGDSGGGTILIGGDEHGANAAVRDAARTYVGQNVTLSADALASGNGGKVVVWSNEVTWYYGGLTARGGVNGGDGGFAEVSGARSLSFLGNSDLSASFGHTGTLLLDPLTITIQHAASPVPGSTDDNQLNAGVPAAGPGSVIGVVDFADNPNAMSISDGKINAIGATNDIELDARQSITANAGVNVSIANNLLLQTSNTAVAGVIDLGLGSFATTTAGKTITIHASTSGANVGDITLGALQTNNGAITVSTGDGAIAVNGALTAGTGLVTLTATTGISESGAGSIAAATLAVSNSTTSGNVTLGQSANAVSTFSGTNTVGGITFVDTTAALTVNAVDTSATAGKNISIQNTGSISVNGAVNAGTGNVSLTATTGISESGTGSIAAAALAVSNTTTSGDVTLGQSANAVSTFSGTNTVGSITFVDTKAALTVNAVDTSATAGKDISIQNAGSISVNGAVNSGTGTILLQADSGGAGTGTLTVGAAITVQSANTTSTAITLQGADIILNAGSLVKATNATGGVVIKSSAPARPMNIGGAAGAVAGINLTDPELLQITTGAAGTITFGDATQTGDITFTTATPATTAGASIVAVQSTAGTGKIVLDTAVGVGPALAGGSSTIALTAGTGGVVEAATNDGTKADIATTGASVTINTTGSAGTTTHPLRFADNTNSAQQVVNVGTLNQPAPPVFLVGLGTLTLGTINTNNADITVNAAGALTLTGPINAGATPGNVRLQAGGIVKEILSGKVTSSALGVFTNVGNIDLSGANVVSTFAAADTAIGQTIVFNDVTTGLLTVGSVSASAGFFIGATGVTTDPSDITIATAGALAITAAINAGAGTGTVRLQAAGDITQTAAGTITGAALGIFDTTGKVDLESANVIGTNITPGVLAAQDTDATSAGTITFTNQPTVATELQIGTVAAATSFPTTVAGITTAGSGAISIYNGNTITAPATVGGALTINQPITAGTGANAGKGTVILTANGNVTQAVAGIITAGTLAVYDTTGDITLDKANVLGTGTGALAGVLAAQDTSVGGNIKFANQATLIGGTELTIDAVTTVPASFKVPGNSITGVVTNNGNAGTATGNITIYNGNLIGVTIGGPLTINQPINAGTNLGTALSAGTVLLQANGTVDQIATGAITALTLGVNTPTGSIDLCLAPNDVTGTFGATATLGSIEFRDVISYTAGVVPAALPLFAGALAGISAPAGDITLISDASLVVNNVGNVLSTTGTVRLQAAGNVTQTATIKAPKLAVFTSGGNIDLELANVIGTGTGLLAGVFVAQDTSLGGKITFTNQTLVPTDLLIDAVASDGCVAAITGVSTNHGDITIYNGNTIGVTKGGAITINTLISDEGPAYTQTPTGLSTVFLEANGAVTESAVKTWIIAGQLGIFIDPSLITASTIDLEGVNAIGTGTTVAKTGVLALQDGTTGNGTTNAITFTNQTAQATNLTIGTVTTTYPLLLAPPALVPTTSVTGVSTIHGNITIYNGNTLKIPAIVPFGATQTVGGAITIATEISDEGPAYTQTPTGLSTVFLEANGAVTESAVKTWIIAGKLGVVVDASAAASTIDLEGVNAIGTGTTVAKTGVLALQDGTTGNGTTNAITFTNQTVPATNLNIDTVTTTYSLLPEASVAAFPPVTSVTGVSTVHGNITIYNGDTLKIPAIAQVLPFPSFAATKTVGGAITINKEISDEGPAYTQTPTGVATVFLEADGAVTESAVATWIIAGRLGVVVDASATASTIDLEGVNAIGTGTTVAKTGVLALQDGTTGNGTTNAITFVNQTAQTTNLNIDTVTTTYSLLPEASVAAFPPVTGVSGVSTNLGDITIYNGNLLTIPVFPGNAVATATKGGAITIDQPLSTGSPASNTILLQANGNVTQFSPGIITTHDLGVSTPLGNIILCLGNLVGGTVGLHAPGGSVGFDDVLGFTTGVIPAKNGTINPGLLFDGADHITTSLSGDVDLTSGGALVIFFANTSGTVRVSAGGDVTQLNGVLNAINAGSLSVFTSAGKIDLENVHNNVATFAAYDSATTGVHTITFVDSAPSLTIGFISGDGCIGPETGVSTVHGDITIYNGNTIPGTTGGSITIATLISDEGPVYPLTPPTGTNTVWLEAHGNVTESAVPTWIIAGQLGIFIDPSLITPSKIDLEGVNAIGTNGSAGVLALQDGTSGNGTTNAITFVNQTTTATNLTIGKVTTTGYTPGLGAQTNATGVSTVHGNITLYNGDTLTIPVFPGHAAPTQSVGGGIGIATLISDEGPAYTQSPTGISTVFLEASGDVTEATVPTWIIAGQLGVFAGGKIDLEGVNAIGTTGSAGVLALQDTSANAITFTNQTAQATNLNIDTVTTAYSLLPEASVAAFPPVTSVTGVSTIHGNITIYNGNSLKIPVFPGHAAPTQTVGGGIGISTLISDEGPLYTPAPTGLSTVFLEASGDVTEATVPTWIIAGQLGVHAGGKIDLEGVNAIGTTGSAGVLALQATGLGKTITFANQTAQVTNLTIGTVTTAYSLLPEASVAAFPPVTSVTGVSTIHGNITIYNGNSLKIPVFPGHAAPTQTVGGGIGISTLISDEGPLYTPAPTGLSTVFLEASGDVTEATVPTWIIAGQLGVHAGGKIDLEGVNAIGTTGSAGVLAIQATGLGNAITFANQTAQATDLTVGAVATTYPLLSLQPVTGVTGVSTNHGNITIYNGNTLQIPVFLGHAAQTQTVGGAIAIATLISDEGPAYTQKPTGISTVFLEASGDVTESALATWIIAGQLGVHAGGKIDLEGVNAIGTTGSPGVLALQGTSGNAITFTNQTAQAANLNIDTVTTTYSLLPEASVAAFPPVTSVTGVSTVHGNITIYNGDTLKIPAIAQVLPFPSFAATQTVGGAITINKEISDEGPAYTLTPMGKSTVWLEANGNVTETVTLTADKTSVDSVNGNIIAGQLGIYDHSGSIDLKGVNSIGTTGSAGVFAALNAGPGGITFVNQTAAATDLTIATVMTTYPLLGAPPALAPQTSVTGVSTTSGDIVLDNTFARTIPAFPGNPATTPTAASNLIVNAVISVTGNSGSITVDTSGDMTVNANAKAATTITNSSGGNITFNVLNDGKTLTLKDTNPDKNTPDISVTGAGDIKINVAGKILDGSPADAATTSLPGIILTSSTNHFFENGVVPHVGQGVSFQPGNGFIIATGGRVNGSSQVSGIGPRVNQVNAATVGSGGSVNVDQNGLAKILLDLSRTNESGDVDVTIKWGDEQTTHLPPQPLTLNFSKTSPDYSISGSFFVIPHTYSNAFALTRPDSNGNQTAPIFVTVTLSIPHLTVDPTNVPAYTLASGGQPIQAATTTTLQFGLIPNNATFLTDQLQATENPIAPRTVEIPSPVQVPAFPLQPFMMLEEEALRNRPVNTFGIPYLRFVHPDGHFDPKQDQVELSLKEFRDLLNKDLRSENWGRYADGRYQIILKPTRESTTERIVLDVYVRQGKVIDFADLEQEPGRKQPQPKPAAPPAAGPQGGDQSRLDREPQTSENFDADIEISPVLDRVLEREPFVAEKRPAALMVPPTESAGGQRPESEHIGDSRPMLGASIIGATLVFAGLRQRWQQQVEADRRQTQSRPLTKVGRLYSRLRRQADQIPTSISD